MSDDPREGGSAPRLHYDTAGSRSAPPVLFLHGFMGRAADWKPIIRQIQDRAFCLAVDLPGHGASVDLPEAAYTMDAATEALVRVLEAEGIEACAVVGYSMGGRTALALALRYPAQCTGLMLESASPGLPTTAERAERRRIDRQRAARIADDFEAFLQDWYRQPLFASLARHNLVEPMIRQRRHNRPDELVKSLRGMGAGAQPSLWERIAELRIPTRALTGRLDGKYVGITERMARRNPRLRPAFVSEVGHNVHAERPDCFLDQLRRFLDLPQS